MPDPIDFKETARALIKQVSPAAGTSVNPTLALLAVETALREAYASGQRNGQPKPGSVPAPARRSPATPIKPTRPEPPAEECIHQWEEAFLDGRAVGSKCVKCEVLERDVQNRCDHFFVDTGAGEICVACRKPRFARLRESYPS